MFMVCHHESLQEYYTVHQINVGQRQVAADPHPSWAVTRESACNLLSFTLTIII